MRNIIWKIRLRKIAGVVALSTLLIFAYFIFVADAFNIFKKHESEAADPDSYANIPSFVVTKEITNSSDDPDHRFKLTDSIDIKITVEGPPSETFDLTDEYFHVSSDPEKVKCAVSSAIPAADSTGNPVTWNSQTISVGSTTTTFDYKCKLIDSDGGHINSNDLPNLMLGNATLTYKYCDPPGDSTRCVDIEYYSQPGVDQQAVNFAQDDGNRTGFIGLNYNPDNLKNLSSPGPFSLTTTGTMFNLMQSRSYLGGYPLLGFTTLLYPQGVITGDTYTDDVPDLDDFYYYGRNLQQSPGSISCSGSTCATWVVGSSTIGPGQAYYDGSSDFASKLVSKLEGEAEEIDENNLNNNGRWNLDLDKSDFNISFPTTNSSAPDGKVWLIDGNLTITSTSRMQHKYKGIGTIIVKRNLTIEEDIIPDNQSKDFLGFIVTGNVTIKKGADVDAAIIAGNELKVESSASRTNLTGSFVAGDFQFDENYGTIIKYRIGLEDHWPPGFRYIKMPIPEKSN